MRQFCRHTDCFTNLGIHLEALDMTLTCIQSCCCLRRYDVEAGRRVRQFRGHTDRITDLGISTDGRWLLASSMDAHLRVYSIPAARLLQVSLV